MSRPAPPYSDRWAFKDGVTARLCRSSCQGWIRRGSQALHCCPVLGLFVLGHFIFWRSNLAPSAAVHRPRLIPASTTCVGNRALHVYGLIVGLLMKVCLGLGTGVSLVRRACCYTGCAVKAFWGDHRWGVFMGCGEMERNRYMLRAVRGLFVVRHFRCHLNTGLSPYLGTAPFSNAPTFSLNARARGQLASPVGLFGGYVAAAACSGLGRCE